MSQEELEELEAIIDAEEEVNDKEEDSARNIPECEAKRLRKMQEDFIAKSKKVQKAECIFVYEKENEVEDEN